ncbi:MAG: hypothetical protein QHH19_04870 [Candidatus Thermoplasmatota archaeon]|nr:hypothetical protein [Candidatus Thermoplasmatota archaeon]
MELNVLFTSILILIIAVEVTIFLFLNNKKQKSEEQIKKEYKKNGLLCRFVVDAKGNKIGESVAVNDDIMIVKVGSRYLGVPLKHVEEMEKTLLVKGLIDFDKAEELGEKWKKESFHEIDHSENAEGKVDEL